MSYLNYDAYKSGHPHAELGEVVAGYVKVEDVGRVKWPRHRLGCTQTVNGVQVRAVFVPLEHWIKFCKGTRLPIAELEFRNHYRTENCDVNSH